MKTFAILICALFISQVFIWFHIRSVTGRTAQRMRERLQKLYSGRHEYQPANPAEFEDLDLEFYKRTQQFFEEAGYRFVADMQSLTLGEVYPNTRVFLRYMLDETGTQAVFIYHFKLKTKKKTTESKIIEIDSEMTNGDFWCSSNAVSAAKMEVSPAIHRFTLLADASASEILRNQKTILTQALKNQGLQLRKFETLDDILEMQHRQQDLKVAFRREQGLMTRTEMEKIAGDNPSRQLVASPIMEPVGRKGTT